MSTRPNFAKTSGHVRYLLTVLFLFFTDAAPVALHCVHCIYLVLYRQKVRLQLSLLFQHLLLLIVLLFKLDFHLF